MGTSVHMDMRAHRPQRNAGFSLLECMLALAIVTLGIVGLMSLQSTGIISVRDAKTRSDAGLLANEMIALLWVDRVNLPAYALNPGTASCKEGGNAPSNMVVAGWLGRIVEGLPGAAAYTQSITIDTRNVVTIVLCWRGPQDSSPRTYATVSQIQG